MTDYALKRTSDPSVEPVTWADMQAHSRIDEDEEDYVDGLIAASREVVEIRLNRALITQTWVYKRRWFPHEFRLPYPPLQSVSSITYVDTAGDTQTVSTDVYDVLTDDADESRIVLKYQQCWPSDVRGDDNGVAVTFVTGYGDAASDVPAGIKHALKLWVGMLFENREAVTNISLKEVPMAVQSLLWAYTVPKEVGL